MIVWQVYIVSVTAAFTPNILGLLAWTISINTDGLAKLETTTVSYGQMSIDI